MCVIIHKPKDVVIPPEKIEQAWRNNKDGFGITFVDRGEFNIRKWLSKDPDDINKFLEGITDCDAMLHLRYKTKGSVSRDNLHPFSVLTQKKHGVNLQFFHNGTLYAFGDADKSDTNDFNDKIIRPMFEMLAVKHELDLNAMLDDPFAHAVIEEFKNTGSVFSMFGDDGCWITFGKGVEHEEGWWSSNDHYFDKYKRETKPAVNQNNTYGGYGQGNFPKDTNKVTYLPGSTKEEDTTQTKTRDGEGATGDTEIKFLPEPTLADTFEETFPELNGLDDLLYYTQAEFESLTEEYPYEAAVLIRCLVTELYWKRYEDEYRNSKYAQS